MNENADSARSMGLIDRLMGEMPAWQKSILTFALIVPLTLALSGVLLQLNVGSIASRYIDFLYENAKAQTADISAHVDEAVGGIRADMERQQSEAAATLKEMQDAIQSTLREVSASNARVEAVERRVDGLDGRVGRLEKWACDRDGKLGIGSCELDQN